MRHADADNFQIRTHTRADFSILDIIGEYTIYLHSDRKTAIGTVRLQKGKLNDNRIVLVKSYHSMQSTQHANVVCCLIFFLRFQTVTHLVVVQGRPRVAQTDFVGCAWLVWIAEIDCLCIRRDPSVLQLAGASRAMASIPFQVYHMPDGHFESFKSWVKRTMSANPVETMYGLHDMVCGCTYEVVCHLCTC